jgi:hypothetical protein
MSISYALGKPEDGIERKYILTEVVPVREQRTKVVTREQALFVLWAGTRPRPYKG